MPTCYRFYIDEFETEHRQHLNLSDNAWFVIKGDIKNFFHTEEQESFSGFLNRIFTNFYQTADASIDLRYAQKIADLSKLFSSVEFSSFEKATIDQFVEKYAQLYESELIQKAFSYPKGTIAKFRINKNNLDILRESYVANYYEGKIGAYLKAIFEEYALKPQNIREQIFFADTFDEIQKAIQNEKKIKLSLLATISGNGKKVFTRRFYVSPYKIVCNETNSFNYLIGYSEEIRETNTMDPSGRIVRTSEVSDKIPACFRLSRIEKASTMVSMGAHISKEHCSELEKLLMERTPMFMVSEPQEIKVRFSDKGLESFRRHLYLRPNSYIIDEDDNHLYTFFCSEYQAFTYFFKFGWDAHVLEPFELNERFLKQYERSFKLYKGMSKEEILNSEKA